MTKNNATTTPSVPQDSQYTTTFKNPVSVLGIKIKNCSDTHSRFVDFSAGILFPVNTDNSINFTENQFNKIMEIIALELKAFVQAGYPYNSKPIQQNDFNIENNITPKGDTIMENQISKQPMIISEMTVEKIQNLIISLPNRPPAMLARDLAEIYGVTTGNLNKAVDRNKDRFPIDFMFQTTDEEKKQLFQFGISKNVPENPYLFTRERANQISSVLHTEIAVQRSIQIMRAFSQIEQGKLQPQKELSRIEYAQRLLQAEIDREAAEKERKRVEAINRMNAPKVEAWNEFLNSDGYYTLTGAFKMMKLQPNVHIRKLRALRAFPWLTTTSSYNKEFCP